MRDSLILYKNRPARVAALDGKKLSIQTADGQRVSVRPKDVTVLHPGPIASLSALDRPPSGEVMAAWELLAGETTTLEEVAELAYGGFTPASAWAIWQLVEDGLYFDGEPDAITVHTAESVESEQSARADKADEARVWQEFLARLEAGEYLSEDEANLQDLVDIAYGRRDQSRLLHALGREQNAESAHALLLKIGYWDETVNPYPLRQKVATTAPEIEVPDLPDEPRLDLTHLFTVAIDDEGSTDPDDAVSWEEGRLWVHIADVAAVVTPDSPLDIEARARGANLYLPEKTIPMLPETTTDVLALGLADVSPALSFGLDIDDEGKVTNLEIAPSWVRVTRLSYEEADDEIDDEPLQPLYAVARRNLHRRRENGSIEIELPEVRLRVEEGDIVIRPLLSLRSRDLVREAMLMAGEAVARYAAEREIPVPFSTQSGGNTDDPMDGEGMAAMFALRRTLKPSRYSTTASPHAGLGLETYAQTTSPLRRYSDLLVHQQLRAFLRGEPVLDEQAITERISEAGVMMRAVRRAERFSNTHWKLIYLMRNPGWQGEGIVVEQRRSRSVVLIPDLDLETEIYGRQELTPDTEVTVTSTEINLPALETRFQC